MKKTFKLTDERIPIPRLVEAIKYEIKKYIKRELRKELPTGEDYWGFDCRFGRDEASCETIHSAEINKKISWAESEKLESFYIEILSKPCRRNKTLKVEPEE
jgi:hypothetical protein